MTTTTAPPRGQAPPAVRSRADGGTTRALIAVVGLAVVTLGTVGGDARWVGALGRQVLSSGHLPGALPYAAAPSTGWVDVPLLAELVLAPVLSLGGDLGLLLAQALAVGLALGVLAADARRAGATDRAVAGSLALLTAGAVTTVLVARLQLFTLMLLPVELALLRAQARRPSGRIWLLVPLLALWSNLHGGALLGLAVALIYLVLERRREAAPLGGLCVAALCLTPALARTPSYYLGVLHNESARQHLGLWSRLSPTSPFDVAWVLSATVLLLGVRRARPRAWELVVLLGLTGLTLQAARNGVWLLVAAVGPAAVGRSGRPRRAGPLPVTAVLWTAATGLAGLALVRGLPAGTTTPAVVRLAVQVAQGSPVAAQDVLSEQVVAAGGRVWMSNPLDAFRPRDQRRYLAWETTGRADLLPLGTSVVLVRPGGPAAAALAAAPDYRRVAGDGAGELFVRSRTAG